MRIRSDMGTENSMVGTLQIFLRDNHDDDYARERSFMVGKSVTNQRIESWWGILRKENSQHWMNVFTKLKDEGHFSGNFLDRSLIQLCFLKIIQNELREVCHVWSSHRIRKTKNANLPGGKPIVLYSCPEVFGSRNYLKEVPQIRVDMCNRQCLPQDVIPCDQAVFDMACHVMAVNQWSSPTSDTEAIELYIRLREELYALLG